jgi:nucleoside-diphosphate-sugar epimerase
MIAVTGASGFVGRAVVELLQSRGEAVRALVRKPTGPQQVAVGEIGPDTEWEDAVQGVGCVIHCAAHVHQTGLAHQEAEDACRLINLHGTTRLAREAARIGVRRLVFVSSVKVMGEASPPYAPWRVSDAPQPVDAYGRSKWAAEQALWEISRETGLEVVVVRPPLVYGYGVKANFLSLMQAVRRGWPMPLGAVRNRRSLVALDNLTDLLALCASAPQAAGQTFFVSDGQDLSTDELVRGLASAMDRKVVMFPVPPSWLRLAGRLTGRSAAIDRLLGNLQVDIGHTIARLDWRPVLTVDQALRKAVQAPEA